MGFGIDGGSDNVSYEQYIYNIFHLFLLREAIYITMKKAKSSYGFSGNSSKDGASGFITTFWDVM